MKGGKRPGAGRPSLGETRRISMTLPTEVWNEIDDIIKEKDIKKAEFFRRLTLKEIRQTNIDDYLKED